MRAKNKIVLHPKLPPDVSDDEIEVSDEDKDFVQENRGFTDWLNTLDTKFIFIEKKL